MKTELIKQLITDNKGIVKTSEVLAAGNSKEFFYQYAEKAGHGIYVSLDVWPDGMYLIGEQFS